mgnify:CR=1 FL=1
MGPFHNIQNHNIQNHNIQNHNLENHNIQNNNNQFEYTYLTEHLKPLFVTIRNNKIGTFVSAIICIIPIWAIVNTCHRCITWIGVKYTHS